MNVWDEKGWIVLYFVCGMVLVDCVCFLLDVGVDVYVCDKDGYIFLYMVVGYGWCNCVKFFLDYGKFIELLYWLFFYCMICKFWC